MEAYTWNYNYTDIKDNDNQYSIAECMRTGFVDAKYVRSANPEYNGNPFIEALPCPRDGVKLTNAYFKPIPMIDSTKLNQMSYVRQKESVLSLKNLRLPLPFHKQLEFINYDVMTGSYALRKPYYWNGMTFDAYVGEKKVELYTRTKGLIGDSAPSGFSLLGASGCGKSSALKILFENMPQLIAHHPKPTITIPQITYIVVACVPNSNFSALYRQIGEAIDWALGNAEPIYEKMIMKCRTVADKQLKVCELIEKFSIGTIVLDEIQLIDFTANKENTYEGLLSIVNKTKVALSVVGTDEAYSALFSKLRNARRSGDYISASNYTAENGADFHQIVELLFQWQWFDQPIVLTDEIVDTLYDCSKGLINQLIWIYKWIMLEYLEMKANGRSPIVDCDFIHKINNKHFKHLGKHLSYMQQFAKEENEDMKILEAAQESSEISKYKMEPLNVDETKKEANVTSQVIEWIRQGYPEFSSDMIGLAVKQVLVSDEFKSLKTFEIARKVLDILLDKPTKKKRRKKVKPRYKDITSYL